MTIGNKEEEECTTFKQEFILKVKLSPSAPPLSISGEEVDGCCWEWGRKVEYEIILLNIK